VKISSRELTTTLNFNSRGSALRLYLYRYQKISVFSHGWKDKETRVFKFTYFLSMTAPLLSLLQDILRSIANYLLTESSQNKRIFHYSYDWLNFLNSNKEYFGKWKKESQIIVLAGANARRFHDLKQFRERIYQCVENSRFLVDIIFDKLDEGCALVELNSVDNVRKCHLRYCDCVATPAMDVDEISFVECRN
jgi:hypothetical protein